MHRAVKNLSHPTHTFPTEVQVGDTPLLVSHHQFCATFSTLWDFGLVVLLLQMGPEWALKAVMRSQAPVSWDVPEGEPTGVR